MVDVGYDGDVMEFIERSVYGCVFVLEGVFFYVVIGVLVSIYFVCGLGGCLWSVCSLGRCFVVIFFNRFKSLNRIRKIVNECRWVVLMMLEIGD